MRSWEDKINLEENSKSGKAVQVIGTIIGIIAIPLLIGWGMNREEKKAAEYPWSVTFYYPKDNINDSKQSGFKTLEECREWAQEKADRLNLEDDSWDYECGEGCKYVDQSIEGGQKVNSLVCTEIAK